MLSKRTLVKIKQCKKVESKRKEKDRPRYINQQKTKLAILTSDK